MIIKQSLHFRPDWYLRNDWFVGEYLRANWFVDLRAD